MSTTTLAPAQPLTAEDVAAMRAATDVSFHVNSDGCFVRLYVRTYSTPAIYTARQQRLFPGTFLGLGRTREIATTGHVYGHGDMAGSGGWSWSSTNVGTMGTPRPGCFYSAYDSAVWETIARSVRVGEQLTVRWTADNNNDLTREAGLHTDMVHLRAGLPDQADRCVWLVGVTTSADNSARMVRRHG